MSASAILCVRAGIGCAQSPTRLAWPPELPSAALPGATFGEYLKKRMPEHFDYIALPAEGNSRDELAISTTQNAPHPAAAAAGIEFIRTDSAAAVYQRYGFDYATAEERARREQK